MKCFYSVLPLLIATSSFTNVFAYCESDYIMRKTSDGSVIVLGSGTSWEIDSIDRIDSALWFPMDDVIACDEGYIIHKYDGEKVGAKKID